MPMRPHVVPYINFERISISHGFAKKTLLEFTSNTRRITTDNWNCAFHRGWGSSIGQVINSLSAMEIHANEPVRFSAISSEYVIFIVPKTKKYLIRLFSKRLKKNSPCTNICLCNWEPSFETVVAVLNVDAKGDGWVVLKQFHVWLWLHTSEYLSANSNVGWIFFVSRSSSLKTNRVLGVDRLTRSGSDSVRECFCHYKYVHKI